MWSSSVTLSVDVGFGSGPFAASPSWTDITSYVRAMTITRGRSSVHQEFSPGTLILHVDNTDGRFDPNNTSSPYDPNLKLGTPVRIQAQYSVTTYDIYYGHIDVWPLTYPHAGKDAVAVLECVENSALISLDSLTEQAYSLESSDTRLGNVLDDVGWPAGARDLDAGTLDLSAFTFTGSPALLLSQLIEAEQGNVFVAGNGDLTFKNRTAFATATSQATYDPGTDLDYVSVELVYDDDTLFNKATVQGLTGTPQTASDATSVSDHGPAGYQTSNQSIPGEADALNVAEWIVGKNKDVTVRVTGFTVHPESDPANLWPEVLSRELLELVTVKVNPPGAGDTLNQVVAIESVQHAVTPGEWVTTYTCRPVSVFETNDYWVLGTSDLGTETVLA